MFGYKVSAVNDFYNAVKKVPEIPNKDIIIKQIDEFIVSRQRREMFVGENYYCGRHDILQRERTVIGEGGKPETVDNLPNNRIVNNQYKKMVDQKVNYLLSKPITFECQNDVYADKLKTVFNKKFGRLLKRIGEDALNCGIAWLYPCYDESGAFILRKFKPFEIKPIWKDADHEELEYAIRIYETEFDNGNEVTVIQNVEIYDNDGITYYEYKDKDLIPVDPYHQNYFTIAEDNKEQGYNWAKIPLIPFKYNAKEIPLINMVKSLQDGLNLILSNFENNMEEDMRNTILVLVNYDGENLGEFRKNLATYGAVKVRNTDGGSGDVRTLSVEVNCENYKAIIELFKKAIIENAMGYDAKDDRLSGNPNQMNIQSMYSDIDLDANGMETEFQASFEELMWFVNCHFANMGYGDFEDELLEIIFNRDMLMNESEVIENIGKSQGILSDETLIAQHPWVNNPQEELERIKKQKEDQAQQYGNAFAPKTGDDGDDVSEE